MNDFVQSGVGQTEPSRYEWACTACLRIAELVFNIANGVAHRCARCRKTVAAEDSHFVRRVEIE